MTRPAPGLGTIFAHADDDIGGQVTTPGSITEEHGRLEEARTGSVPWKAWGPYLSERQWGTVREDYSQNGDAWNYFTHDQARSRGYRWGEDGVGGISDDGQRLCLALAVWNGADPILKQRMFGLSNSEGNHGEDVKEYWFYLDSTPTHSYMRCQCKYPQREFPYFDLVSTNQRRGKQDMEYELVDAGIFDDDRYFDVIVEYAKAAHDDILMLVTAHSRGPDPAALHLLPSLWFRNTWSWADDSPKPRLTGGDDDGGTITARASHSELGDWLLRADASAQLLVCENETNNRRLFGAPNASPYVKDGINDFVVSGAADAVNPDRTGTEVAAHHVLEIAPGRVRLGRTTLRSSVPPAESDTGMFGGNSNWRGPVWFPMNLVILRALVQLHGYYGDGLKVECPTGSGAEMDLFEVAGELGRRLMTTFTEDEHGRRPVFGGIEKFQTDPHWHNLLLFHEYFHGDNGAGVGASHQTGWTGTVALLPTLAGALRGQAAQIAN